MAGAVGEHKVQKELQKLTGNITIINDFNTEFNPPLYNRNTKERIHSIQVDHLLVSNRGVFVIETKNWSKESLTNNSFWSPVEQVQRSGYAVFVLLNGTKKDQAKLWLPHFWGDQKIAVKSLLVFVGEKPNKSFKNVKILALKQLNSYIEYFEPIYNDKELEKIVDYLLKLRS